jgi:hypothetical protein
MLIQKRTQRKAGSALVVCLVTGMILGIVMVGYLTMVSSNQRAVARSEAWNTTMPVIEAGIEEAMAHLHRNFPTNRTSNGWMASGTSNVLKWRWLGDSIYLVEVQGTNEPVIESSGFVRMPVNNVYLGRRVRVRTVYTNVISRVVFADETIKLNGYSMNTDSYDSRDTNYSSVTGQYDPAKNKDGGDVGTNSDDPGAFNSGNSQILGRVSTGSGSTVDIGANGSIGSEAWHLAGNKGVEPGWSADDANVPMPVVQLPFNGGAFTPGPGLVGLTFYNYVLGSGNYQLSSFGGKVRVTGNAVLLVTDRVQFSGQDVIEIMPGASLKLYVAARDASIGGSGVVNMSGLATSFSYFGLPSNESLSIGGNSSLAGLIYAPSTAVQLNGGGNVYGAIMCKSASVNGAFNFHFDEALKDPRILGRYTIVSWDEI